MSKSKKQTPQRGARQRRILVRGVRRETPDVRKLSRALIELAVAQAEADAQASPKANATDAPGEVSKSTTASEVEDD